jgi:hypothetical protein
MRNSYNKFRYAIDESDGAPPDTRFVALASLRSAIAQKRLKQGVFATTARSRQRPRSAPAFVFTSFANAME